MNKKNILIISIIIILVGIIFVINNRTNEVVSNEDALKVELLNVSDLKENDASIFAFGEVESMEQVDVRAQVGGEINAIYVNVGEVVSTGDLLLELDHDSLDVRLEQSAATVERVESSLNQVLAGATDEQISAVESQINSAKIVYENAQDSLENMISINDKNLSSTYDSAFNALNDVYIKMYNASTTVKRIQLEYFTNNDQKGLAVRSDQEYKINIPVSEVELLVDKAQESKSEEDINDGISKSIAALDNVLLGLTSIRNVCEEVTYKNIVTSTDKTSLDSQKTIISSSRTAISSLQNEISLLKIQNSNNIDSAEFSVEAAKANLESQNANYDSLVADPRDVDISSIQASVKEAKAAYNLAKNNRNNAFIRAPFYGKVSSIPFKRNNVVSAGQVVVSMINDSGLQIKAYISPEDRKLIKEGANVIINDSYSGNVSNIAPSIDSKTKKIEINIVIADINDLLIGEYVNLKININEESLDGNVYFLPMESIYITPQKSFVFIINKDNEAEEIEIKTGRVVNDLIEVLDGLEFDMDIVKSTRGIRKGDKIEIK